MATDYNDTKVVRSRSHSQSYSLGRKTENWEVEAQPGPLKVCQTSRELGSVTARKSSAINVRFYESLRLWGAYIYTNREKILEMSIFSHQTDKYNIYLKTWTMCSLRLMTFQVLLPHFQILKIFFAQWTKGKCDAEIQRGVPARGIEIVFGLANINVNWLQPFPGRKVLHH